MKNTIRRPGSRELVALGMCFIGAWVVIFSKLPTSADEPRVIVPDPRTVTSKWVSDGHVITFDALTPKQSRDLPLNFVHVSIDGRPGRWYAIGRRTAPVTIDAKVLDSIVVADANQGTGNYPGVVSVSGTAGNNANIVVTGSPSTPVLDLNSGITLTGTTAITLTSTAGPVISGGGSGGTNPGLAFFTSASPGADAFVFSVANNPTGTNMLVNIKNQTASVTTIDPLGNFTATGSVTAQNAMVANVAANNGVPLTLNGHSTGQSGLLFSVNQSAGGTNVLAIGPNGNTTVAPASTGVVPFIVNGFANSTQDLQDWNQTPGGVNAFKVDQFGNFFFGGVTSTGTRGAGFQVISNETKFLPPSSTQPWTWLNAANTVILGQVPDGGGLKFVPTGATMTSPLTYFQPFYADKNGTASTAPRMFHFSLSTTIATSTSCVSLGLCTLTTSTVTLGGDLAGTGGYNCVLTDTTPSPNNPPRLAWSYTNSTDTISLTTRNLGTGTLVAGNAVAVNGLCWHD